MASPECCKGCKDDFYNNNNEYGIKKCWYRKYIKRGKCPMRPRDYDSA